MKLSIAIRDAMSRYDSEDHMIQVKVFVNHVPTDMSWGEAGPDHNGNPCLRNEDGCAQYGVYCLPGQEAVAAICAYERLYAEYCSYDGTDRWSKYLPVPGKWILDIPHSRGCEGMSTIGCEFVELDI